MNARSLLLACLLACCFASTASATVTVLAGYHVLLGNTPGQVVSILISSDIPQGIQSADLGLEIPVGGPIITNVDMTSPGTIFGDAPAGNAGQSDFEAYPTYNQLSSIATNSGDTAPAAGGVLAFVTVDTTGVLPGLYPFRLTYAPFFLPTSTSSIPFQGTVLVDGTVIPDPEPSSLVLALIAAGTLGGAWLRRRNQARRLS